MKRFFIAFCLLAINYTAFGQLNEEIEALTPVVIENKLTKDHVNIPGTKISIVPADGYKVSEDFSGLVKGAHQLVAYDLDGGNFAQNTRSFTRARFEKEGGAINKFERFEINGYQSVMIDYDTYINLQQIVIGDDGFSAMLLGTTRLGDAQTKAEIRKMMLSVVYEKEKEIDPMEFADFEVDLSETNLEFTKYTGNMFFYTTQGLENIQGHPEGASLMVGQVPSYPNVLNNLELIANQTLSKLIEKGGSIEIIEKGETEIDGLKAFYVTLFSDSNLQKTKIHLVIAANEQKMFMIHAGAFADYENNIEQLKKAISNMKFN